MLKDNNQVIGLDIGSSTITIAVGEIDGNELRLCHIHDAISSGVTKAGIPDPDEFVFCIQRALKLVFDEWPIHAKNVVLNVPFPGLRFSQNVGMVQNKNEGGMFVAQDQIDVLKQSKNIAKPDDETMMHAMPLYFKVDEIMMADPVGVKGDHLEVNTHMIFTKTAVIQLLSQALKSMDCHIEGIVYDGLGLAQVVLTPEERQQGAAIIDIGANYTKCHIFKHGVCHRSCVVPYGSSTLTSDIATCLKTTPSEAERLKLSYGHAYPKDVDPHQELEVLTVEDGKKNIKRKYLAQIIDARLSEILSLLFKKLPSDLDPNYPIIVAGGGSQLDGLKTYFERRFANPIRIGIGSEYDGIIEKPTHASAVGLLSYALKVGAISSQKPKRKNFLKRVFQKFSVFK